MAILSYWRKYMHLVLINRLQGSLTALDLPLTVLSGQKKTQIKQTLLGPQVVVHLQ